MVQTYNRKMAITEEDLAKKNHKGISMGTKKRLQIICSLTHTRRAQKEREIIGKHASNVEFKEFSESNLNI
jgi:hypothetical protein